LRTSALAALPLAVLLAASAPPSAVADDVYLTNGQVFEGVVTRRDGDTVRIRMAHGEMGLPASWIERIDESDSALAGYLERREALEPGASASEWLELAVWAQEHGLAESARESALRAAALDPGLAGLAPVLRPAGFTFDPEVGEWLTEPQLMARRGYVQVGNEWLPRSVVEERARLAREEQAEAERRAREARLERVIAALALTQLQERAEEASRPPSAEYGPAVVGSYAGYAPVFHTPRGARNPERHGDRRPPRREPPPIHPPRTESHRSGYEALAGRQPGSIIPIALDPGAARAGASSNDGD
jgi:hypothetical protein